MEYNKLGDKKMISKEKALEMFAGGYNCSQSVFASIIPDKLLDKKVKISLAAGFGAGIGRNAETCGAVSGAIMALGAVLIEKDFVSDLALKTDGIMLADKFIKKFKAEKNTIICRELLGYDLSKPEEDEILKNNGSYRIKCADFVGLAVEIAEGIIKEYKDK